MKRSMSTLGLISVLVWGLATHQAAHAQTMVTEVIPIKFRTAAELLHIVQPLVPKPGSVSAFQSQLIVRTTAHNLEELQRVLAELDRAPRSLMITVRQGVSEEVATDFVDAFATVKGGDIAVSAGTPSRAPGGLGAAHHSEGTRAGVRALSTRSRSSDRDVQRIRVLEGREAFIRTGQAIPVADRHVIVGTGGTATVHDSIRYQNVTSGFYVVARLSADRVTLDISPHRARISERGGGAIDIQQAHTSLSGRLGEWIEIGGVTGEAQHRDGGIVYSTRARGETDRRIYLKVEQIASSP